MKIQRCIRGVTLLLGLLLLVIFLWWHYQLGVSRYFDVDEFAHLHWTSRILMGERPYIDFFSFFPPGFWWFLAPFVKLSWGGVGPLLATRVVMFAVFVGLCITSALVFRELRGRMWAAMVVALVLSFLPLPFDKFLEVRPDLLATLLLMVGLYMELRFFRTGAPRAGFWSGIWYGLSILVLTKSLPQVGLGMLVAVIAMRKKALPMIAGLGIPLGLFFLWITTTGDISLVIYSLTKLPLEANRISLTFFMSPDLFFYPNAIFYGLAGYSRGLIVNHILWFIGMFFGIYRLFTPFNAGRGGVWQELLVSGTFSMHIALYVLYYPLKHTQYLIPIAVFVAIFVADLVGEMWKRVETSKVGSVAAAGTMLVMLLVLYDAFTLVNRPKLAWTNAQTLSDLSTLFASIPERSYVLDLEGSMIYARDPYYVCCLPFGQFAGYLSRPLPSLWLALETTKTPFIYKGTLNRLEMLSPQDQSYIAAHYRESGVSQLLLERIP